jgi:hypothetical protein
MVKSRSAKVDFILLTDSPFDPSTRRQIEIEVRPGKHYKNTPYRWGASIWLDGIYLGIISQIFTIVKKNYDCRDIIRGMDAAYWILFQDAARSRVVKKCDLLVFGVVMSIYA